jgi:endonuclease/exonuclease/phosphatase family metal-dependent hydrolase
MHLKIASSNIRFDNPQDGIHAWDNRKNLLQKIINDFHPHILGTQEGREQQIKSLAKLLSLKLVEEHRKWIDERMYPCLYINEEKIKLHQSGDIWLSETPYVSGSKSFKSAFPRLCTWMHVTYLINDCDYFVVNTHLDHVLAETRIQQINVLIDEVNRLNTKNLPVILMGDFNDSPLSEVRNTVSTRWGLKDPWFEMKLPEETSHHGFKGETAGGDRIDWILVPESFAVEDIHLEKNSFENIFPSDHYPLFATLIPR